MLLWLSVRDSKRQIVLWLRAPTPGNFRFTSALPAHKRKKTDLVLSPLFVVYIPIETCHEETVCLTDIALRNTQLDPPLFEPLRECFQLAWVCVGVMRHACHKRRRSMMSSGVHCAHGVMVMRMVMMGVMVANHWARMGIHRWMEKLSRVRRRRIGLKKQNFIVTINKQR